MNNRPTVWVLKEQVKSGPNGVASFDYTPAYKYGDIRFMTDFDLPVHAGSSLARAWHLAVDSCLGEMDDEKDFLILTGAPLAIYALGQKIAAAQMRPKLLVWRREQNAYAVFEATFPTPIHSQ
jgi:hypothetical protein